jgi:hypothetical protein
VEVPQHIAVGGEEVLAEGDELEQRVDVALGHRRRVRVELGPRPRTLTAAVTTSAGASAPKATPSRTASLRLAKKVMVPLAS